MGTSPAFSEAFHSSALALARFVPGSSFVAPFHSSSSCRPLGPRPLKNGDFAGVFRSLPFIRSRTRSLRSRKLLRRSLPLQLLVQAARAPASEKWGLRRRFQKPSIHPLSHSLASFQEAPSSLPSTPAPRAGRSGPGL